MPTRIHSSAALQSTRTMQDAAREENPRDPLRGLDEIRRLPRVDATRTRQIDFDDLLDPQVRIRGENKPVRQKGR
jgi:hypothetical protein